MTFTQFAYLLVGMAGITFFSWRSALWWNRLESRRATDVGPLVSNGIITALFIVGAATLIYLQFGEKAAQTALSLNFLCVVAAFGLFFVLTRHRQIQGKQRRDEDDVKAKPKGLPRRLLARAKRKIQDQ